MRSVISSSFGLKPKHLYGQVVNHLVLVVVVLSSLNVPHNVNTQNVQGINISPTSNFVQAQLAESSVIPVTISELPAGTAFSLLEVHSVLMNVTVSQTQALTPGQFISGKDVGLVVTGVSSGATPGAYIRNENNVSVNILVILNAYNADAPIPGGCNMEVPIKTAPFLPTSFTQNVLTVEFPLGSWPTNVKPATCDRAPLQYDIFIYYLSERDWSERTAFDSIRLMSNVTSIEQYGTKVIFNGIPPSKVKFANYAGTGRIVAVVLRTLTASAAYVPTLSYGCSLNSEDIEENCDVLGSTEAKLLSAWLVFAGLFLVSLGHRYYKCQLFLFGFFVSALLFYLILMLSISVGNTVAGTTSTVVGAVGGATWVTIWAKCGTPIGPVFLASFILGVLFASTLAFTPLADISVMKDDATFWLAFCCLILVIPLLIVSLDKTTSILVSSIFGAYVFIIPLDHYIGSNLKFILLNVLRRATDRDFGTAVIQPPFQSLDLVLTFTWGAVAVAGLVFQLWREKNRPPFPPTPGPWTWPTRRRLITQSDESVVVPIPTENSPLLTTVQT